FQIAYAMSIHKAQGLEYDSVKLVIPCEVDDLVTHDIFYTGVTRAKRRLRIYWEPESQEKILESFEGRDGREGIIKKELTFLKQIAKKRGNKI
ncbi:MAG: ATP-binding domain-containing protein, partial [Atopobiaceae bacterium]|nr:ATP-binding domain-containing protein [Atopobiaceae bacterium]